MLHEQALFTVILLTLTLFCLGLMSYALNISLHDLLKLYCAAKSGAKLSLANTLIDLRGAVCSGQKV